MAGGSHPFEWETEEEWIKSCDVGMQNCRDSNRGVGNNQNYNWLDRMNRNFYYLLISVLLLVSCNNAQQEDSTTLERTPEQEALIQEGWNIVSDNSGDLGKEYGVTPQYGILDNYFDIYIDGGLNVAVKIVDADNDQCIRYVYVPNGEQVTVGQIPQGRYYLKLAYGRDWMETEEDGMTKGKFTRNTFFERSVSCYDFGKKNSQTYVNYSLELNVRNGDPEHEFETVSITEVEFYD